MDEGGRAILCFQQCGRGGKQQSWGFRGNVRSSSVLPWSNPQSRQEGAEEVSQLLPVLSSWDFLLRTMGSPGRFRAQGSSG